MERRINKVPSDISWVNFRKQFWKFFPISKESERIAKLKSEYERLTGRKPEEASGKTQGTKQASGNIEPQHDGGKSSFSDKGSRKRGGKSEHGSTLSRERFQGEKTS